jgi:branched-subunit amino acid ABC-type transport system permease component
MDFSQFTVNTLVWACELGLIALGMSLSYSILGFANFAHIEFLTAGAYTAWVLYTIAGLPIAVAVGLAMIAIGFLAIGIDWTVFRRLRHASAPSKMIASVGIGIAIRSVIQVIFGSGAVSFGFSSEPLPPILGARVTPLYFWIIGLTVISMLAFHGLLTFSNVGKALRATSEDFNLAEVRGINGEQMIRLMWFISGAFAALGGILLGMETQVRPGMGLSVLVPVFAAVTLGTLGSAYGAIGGALVVAFAQNIALAVDIGPLLAAGRSILLPTIYKNAVALTILVLTLLIRPKGLFSPKES